MSSQKQIDANRKNARKSTGPITAEGRAVSSRNALRHGLTATSLFMSDEEQAEFEELLHAFETELQPAGMLEQALVQEIVGAHWRLRRLRQIETGVLQINLIDEARQIDRDYTGLGDAERLGYVVRQDARCSNTLANLSRYEARLERTFYRALHELQRRQSARPPASPPPSPQLAPSAVLPNEPIAAGQTPIEARIPVETPSASRAFNGKVVLTERLSARPTCSCFESPVTLRLPSQAAPSC
jgi:hypothetical protein